MTKATKKKVALCEAIIRWLVDNPQTIDGIMHQFSLSRTRFANLRCSQAWHDAEATLGLAVERPTRQVDANGDVTYLYEATTMLTEGMTVRGLLVAMHDAATRLDTIMGRSNIYEMNETDAATQRLLIMMHSNNTMMVTALKNNVKSMDSIVEFLEEAAAEAAAEADAATAEA